MGTKVAFETTLGAFTVELDEEKAPKTAANFLRYVDEGHYDGVVFHRVIPNFMAQGGGFELKGEDLIEKPTHDSIENEADNGLKNQKGALAMARTSDPHSASAQFFINFVDNDFLDHSGKSDSGWGYAVFGQVVSGMDVVDSMASESTGRRMLGMRGPSGRVQEMMSQDVPMEDIVITSAKRA